MNSWLYATLLGFIVGWAAISAYMAFRGVAVDTLLRANWIPAVVGAPVGALPGAWIGALVGSRRPWMLGALTAAAGVVGVTIGFSVFLIGRLGG